MKKFLKKLDPMPSGSSLPVSGPMALLRNSIDPDGSKYGKYLDPLGLFHDKDGPPNTEASDRMAALHRAEWDDYVQRFQPYDQKLLDSVRGDTLQREAVDRAGLSTNQAFDTARGSAERDRGRVGLADVDPTVRAHRDQEFQASKSAAMATNKNLSRLHADDRAQKVMAGNMAVGLRDYG